MNESSASALSGEAWTRFRSSLRAYVRRRADPAAVDDLVGDILLRLVQHQDELKAARNPAAWTLRVAANVLADHYRRRAAEQRTLELAQSHDPTTAARDAEAHRTASLEIAQCLVPLLEGLPEPYREALSLTEVDGLTQAAAAARLGLSVSAMKSRVQRGRRKLKDALLRCCVIQVDPRGAVLDFERRANSRREC